MSTEEHKDGAAFAPPFHGRVPGMSLRDWFAGQALAGILGNIDMARGVGVLAKQAGEAPEGYLAEVAYAHADAMLKAREATP